MSINLKLFCSKDDFYRNLHEAFSRGQWTYATDGHVAVRVPLVPGVRTRPDAPPIEKLPFPTSETSFLPAPSVTFPAARYDDCPSCSGRGHKHDCPACECACEDCRGVGQIIETVTVGIGATIFKAADYIRIQALPGLHLGPLNEKCAPVPFRFEGGDGLIMPTRKAAAKHVEVAAPNHLTRA